MLVTSKEANKILQQLQVEKENLFHEEEQSSSFLAAVGEDVESCRPEYDYDQTNVEIKELNKKIIKVKHAINKFNNETVVDEFNMTIDELLILLPQLTQSVNRLYRLQSAIAKEREMSLTRSNIIDYRYANYDIHKAKEDYKKAQDELKRAQLALDKINVSKTFELEI